MQINYSKARRLCTDTEFELLTAAKPAAISKLSASELRKLLPRVRKVSDKWLAQSRAQGNSSDGSAARSQEKHEIFKEVVSRLEAKLDSTPTTSAKKTPAKKAAPKKAPSKKATQKRAPAKKAAVKKAPAKKKVAKASGGSPAKKPTTPKSAVAPPSAIKKAKARGIGSDLRIAASGKSSRVRGHVSAQGRRNQAARSARKR